jgi:hypothetical protein
MQNGAREVCRKEMSRLYDTIKMDVTEMRCKDLDISVSKQDRETASVTKVMIPS